MPQSFWSSALALLYMLLSLGFVLFLAWFVLRYIGKRGTGMQSGTGGAIKVLDRLVIGKDQSILLIKTGSKTLLVAFSVQGAQTLCEFSEDEQFPQIQAQAMPDFSAILKKAASVWPSKAVKEEDKPDEQ